MKKDKIITMLIVGAAIGSVAALLFTDKGKQISGKIKEDSSGLLDTLCSAFDKGKAIVSEYAEKWAEKASDIRDEAEDAAGRVKNSA